jgi:DNA-binding NarL/FixJ family response regulator
MIRILIADDHEIVRGGLKSLLESQQGLAVVAEAGDGREALAKALETKPDVVILDYVMPLMNGAEVTRQIRSRLPTAEVMIFSMHDSDALVGELLQAGARAFVMKSEPGERVVAAVRSLANHRPFLAGEWSERLLEGFLERQNQTGGVLSPRERVIVQLIAEGHSNKEMGTILNLSVKTIETHRATAMQKLHIKTTAGLVRYAIKNRLIEA